MRASRQQTNSRAQASLPRLAKAYFEPILGFPVNIVITADSDVESDVTSQVRGRQLRRNIKAILNNEVAAKMTVDMLHDNGTYAEIKGWFDTIIGMAQ